jgi:hypothetical protein
MSCSLFAPNEGVHAVTQSLQNNGCEIKTTKWQRFSLNALTHMSILFAALLLIFIFVISAAETRALQGEVDNALKENLKTALEEANEKSDGDFKEQISVIREPIQVMRTLYSGDDEATKLYNDGLFTIAFLVLTIFLCILLTSFMVLYWVVGVRSTSKAMKGIVVENIILFSLIGIVEYLFFTYVAMKYLPVEPSLVTRNIISEIKDVFNTD